MNLGNCMDVPPHIAESANLAGVLALAGPQQVQRVAAPLASVLVQQSELACSPERASSTASEVEYQVSQVAKDVTVQARVQKMVRT